MIEISSFNFFFEPEGEFYKQKIPHQSDLISVRSRSRSIPFFHESMTGKT